MALKDIQAELHHWLHHPKLWDETNLLMRAEALDFLYFVTTIAPDMEGVNAEVTATIATAHRLMNELTTHNTILFQRVRQAIIDGTLHGAALRTYFVDYEPINSDRIYTSYGALDVLVDGIFALQSAPPTTMTRTAEMVQCEETPALAILDLVDQLDLTSQDRFYDLGCGLGQVVMLVNLLSGAPACGVEIEPAFVTYAQQQAQTLKMNDVRFLQGDAQVADYDDGTAFFLFTPFRGAMMRQVLARLRTIASAHPICVCTFGPCTPIVAAEPWLRSRSSDIPHESKLTIFDSTVSVL